MSEPIDLDQLLEQRERLAASIEEKKREASERRREADERRRDAKKGQAELKDLERQVTRAKLEQAEQPAGRWARLRHGVRSQVEMRRQVRELEAENERLRGYESKVKTVESVAGRVLAVTELREASRAWFQVAKDPRRIVGDDWGEAALNTTFGRWINSGKRRPAGTGRPAGRRPHRLLDGSQKAGKNRQLYSLSQS